eukprot:4110654-Amphidinium_carterae.1
MVSCHTTRSRHNDIQHHHTLVGTVDFFTPSGTPSLTLGFRFRGLKIGTGTIAQRNICGVEQRDITV